MTPRDRTVAYQRVFGQEGFRTDAQKAVWSDIMKEILVKDSIRAERPKTARDMCLEILDVITSKYKEKEDK